MFFFLQVKRILKIVREEYARAARGKAEEEDPQESLQKLLMAAGDQVLDADTDFAFSLFSKFDFLI